MGKEGEVIKEVWEVPAIDILDLRRKLLGQEAGYRKGMTITEIDLTDEQPYDAVRFVITFEYLQ